jgi:hypothetical protein
MLRIVAAVAAGSGLNSGIRIRGKKIKKPPAKIAGGWTLSLLLARQIG